MVIKEKKRPRDLPEKLGKICQLPIDSSDALSLSVRSLVGIGHLTRLIWQLFNRYTIQHRWDCRILTILQMCERRWRISSLVNRCGDLLKNNLLTSIFVVPRWNCSTRRDLISRSNNFIWTLDCRKSEKLSIKWVQGVILADERLYNFQSQAFTSIKNCK